MVSDNLVQFGSAARHRLDADTLMQTALLRAGRTQYSQASFVEPLKRLLRAYDEEAQLSFFGRYAARFDVMRCLNNLLRLDAAEEADPAITARPIAAPLFITGLPRSSTTFLHALLAQDPANAVPRCWELIYPYPSRGRWFGRDRRRDLVERQLRIFRLLSPGVARLHPLSADTPQECTDITAQVFQSLRFDTTHNIPTYQAWFDRHGHDDAFRFHRRFLQHLDAQRPGRRWILKSPDHVFALETIRGVYPDATIIFMHRDPLSVVASCAKLTELLRKPFTRSLDRRQVGRAVAARLIESAHRMAAAAESQTILHLYYRDVVADPVGTVARIYAWCGRELGVEAATRMREWLARRKVRRRPRYDLAEFGLDPGLLRDRFARYMDYFAVPKERSA
jgi:Sulfotransferase family